MLCIFAILWLYSCYSTFYIAICMFSIFCILSVLFSSKNPSCIMTSLRKVVYVPPNSRMHSFFVIPLYLVFLLLFRTLGLLCARHHFHKWKLEVAIEQHISNNPSREVHEKTYLLAWQLMVANWTHLLASISSNVFGKTRERCFPKKRGEGLVMDKSTKLKWI